MSAATRRPGRRRSAKALGGDRRAVAALEFGLIAPLMLTLMLGTIELVNVLRVQLKVNVAASQLAEMIASSSAVTEASSAGSGGSLTDMCTAASYNLLPYNNGTMSASIASITVTSGLAKAVDWATDKACPTQLVAASPQSTALTTGADTPRSLFTLDGTPSTAGGTLVKGYSAISLQVSYVYTDLIPFVFSPSITFTSAVAVRPRSNTTIPCSYPSGSSSAACSNIY